MAEWEPYRTESWQNTSRPPTRRKKSPERRLGVQIPSFCPQLEVTIRSYSTGELVIVKQQPRDEAACVFKTQVLELV